MDINTDNKIPGAANVTLGAVRGVTECTVDYVLPDYKADIKRVLHSEARVLPAGEYENEDGVELTGIVAFDIMYLSAENKLVSVSFTGEWSYAHKGKLSGICSDAIVDGITVRLTGPRKIGAKCRVVIDVYGTIAVECNPIGTALEAENMPEAARCAINARNIKKGSLSERELAEELVFLPGSAVDEVEIVSEKGKIAVGSVSFAEGVATVSGELAVSSVIEVGGSAPRTASARIPFEERIEIADAKAESFVLASGRVSSLSVKPEATEDGVRITADAIIELDVRAYSNERMELTADVFSRVREVENEYMTLEYPELIDVRRASVRKGREVAKSETDVPFATDIVYLDVTVRDERVSLERSGVKIEGEILFSGVACEVFEDGTSTYSSLRIHVPFSENVNFNVQIPENTTVEYSVDVTDARVELDAHSFYPECTLTLSVVLIETHSCTYLARSEARELYAETRSASVVTVYYPEEGETLFGVAKKFRTSPVTIASDNALTEGALSTPSSPGSLAGIKKMIIR